MRTEPVPSVLNDNGYPIGHGAGQPGGEGYAGVGHAAEGQHLDLLPPVCNLGLSGHLLKNGQPGGVSQEEGAQLREDSALPGQILNLSLSIFLFHVLLGLASQG